MAGFADPCSPSAKKPHINSACKNELKKQEGIRAKLYTEAQACLPPSAFCEEVGGLKSIPALRGGCRRVSLSGRYPSHATY